MEVDNYFWKQQRTCKSNKSLPAPGVLGIVPFSKLKYHPPYQPGVGPSIFQAKTSAHKLHICLSW